MELRKVPGAEKFSDEVLAFLQDKIKEHMKVAENWQHGKPIKLFVRDDAPCIRYESGEWYHYTRDGWY